jgi:exonuclease III
MRLVSWNVAGRRARQPEQAAAVLSLAPDVVCLQEATVNSLPAWREALGAALLNVHSPISPSPDLAKVRTHEALYAWAAGRPRAIIVGDLNTPRRDLPDGTVLTFAHDTKGRVREERGERWVAAERALVHTLRAEHGWTDAFAGAHERTWTYPRGKGGYRLDHALVKGVEVTARAYAHEWRLSGLSDHSAVLVDLDL